MSGIEAAHRRARRQQLGARRRSRRPDGHLGQRRLRRGRGDAPLPRLLVEPRRLGHRGLPCRQRPRAAVVDRRSRRPAQGAATRSATRPPAPPTPTSPCTCSRSTAASVEIMWDRESLPYLADVSWAGPDRLLLGVQSRDQRTFVVLEADPRHRRQRAAVRRHRRCVGRARAGQPGDARRRPAGASPPTAKADGACSSTATTSRRPRCRCGRSPTSDDDITVPRQPARRRDRAARVPLGRRVGRAASPTTTASTAVVGRRPSDRRASATLGARRRRRRCSRSTSRCASFARDAARTSRTSRCTSSVPNRIATAVLLPHDHDGSKLPVLLDPYGGPHAPACRAVVATRSSRRSGSPTRGTRSSSPTVAARRVAAASSNGPCISTSRPARSTIRSIALAGRGAASTPSSTCRGWRSGGGASAATCAALAVLQRPDVFHAAIAGAPVTEWRLYDTHYTERYLGDPSVDAAPYARTSLLPLAHQLTRPLLLVHGSRRRQRRGRTQPAAVVGAARRRQAARTARRSSGCRT